LLHHVPCVLFVERDHGGEAVSALPIALDELSRCESGGDGKADGAGDDLGHAHVFKYARRSALGLVAGGQTLATAALALLPRGRAAYLRRHLSFPAGSARSRCTAPRTDCLQRGAGAQSGSAPDQAETARN